MDSFVHGNGFFFALIDRLMCTIQSNQMLDALIKYVAQYPVLYSGQLEIRLSVCNNLFTSTSFTVKSIVMGTQGGYGVRKTLN